MVDLIRLVHAIAAGDAEAASEMLEAAPRLALERAAVGATRETADEYYFERIGHHLYEGDTALHIAAASYDTRLTRRLLELGADCSARNRRGAEPLHYAADTFLGDDVAQTETIACLCRAGANPNAVDKSGVASLHRAVRTRGAAAVKQLLDHGAEPRMTNQAGSTPLHLAVQNTGRGGSGTPRAIEQQRLIIRLLLEHGAKVTDRDGRGKTVSAAASAEWIRELLEYVEDGLRR